MVSVKTLSKVNVRIDLFAEVSRASYFGRFKPKGRKDGGKNKPWEDRKPSRDGDRKPKRKQAEPSEESGFKRKPRKKTHADMPTPPAQDFSNGKPKKPHKKKLARAVALKAGKGTKKGSKKNTRKSRKG